jgi:hypothetical protein
MTFGYGFVQTFLNIKYYAYTFPLVWRQREGCEKGMFQAKKSHLDDTSYYLLISPVCITDMFKYEIPTPRYLEVLVVFKSNSMCKWLFKNLGNTVFQNWVIKPLLNSILSGLLHQIEKGGHFVSVH